MECPCNCQWNWLSAGFLDQFCGEGTGSLFTRQHSVSGTKVVRNPDPSGSTSPLTDFRDLIAIQQQGTDHTRRNRIRGSLHRFAANLYDPDSIFKTHRSRKNQCRVFAQAQPGAVLDAAALKAAITGRVAYDLDPLVLVVVPEMPMTPTGKIAKADLARSDLARKAAESAAKSAAA